MTRSSKHSRNTSSQSKLEKVSSIGLSAIKAISEINQILDDHGFGLEPELPTPQTQAEAEALVIHIFHRFHTVATTLLQRHNNRPTIVVEDEKDAQDLLHGLLWLHFNDVRKEEPTESVAGGTTFIDFLLPELRVGIEVKMGYVGNRELRKQINDDKGNYVAHSKCDKLLVIVYDPDHNVRNPPAFEKHLSTNISGLDTKVFVLPKPHP